MERVLESLFASEGELVWVYDRDLKLVFANAAAARLLDAKASELVGKSVTELIPTEEELIGEMREVIASKRPLQRTRQYAGRSYEQSLTPILTDGGEIELLVSSNRDITQRLVGEQRAQQLQTLTERLAATLSRQAIANVVIAQLHGFLNAAASVAYFATDESTMALAASRGLSPELAKKRATMTLNAPLPLAKAIATNQLVWYENREALLADYPAIAQSQLQTIEAIIAVPIVFEGRALGGIAFSFEQTTHFDAPTRALLATFSLQCAQAVERTRLYEDERRARERLTILAETSDALSHAQLELSQVLDTVCREVATRMAEVCTINLVGDDGKTLEVAALYHIDPIAQEHVRKTLELSPAVVGDQTALGRVAATGDPVFVPVVPFEQMLATMRPEHRAHVERYPIGSLIVVPLRVREQILGTLTSSRSLHTPPFTADDHRLLQDIADRAGIAIANAQLFAAERMARQLRDDFLAIAGHELRTPLAAMQLQVDSLITHTKRGTFATRPELLGERLDKTARAVTRLERLIRQLLDVSQLVRGRLAYTREEMDLRELAAEVIDRAAEHAARTGSKLTLEPGDAVIGHWDRGRLDQVITNLVDNALKYGQGRPVEIGVSSDATTARLVVRDQGMGIAAEAQSRMFGRFERAVSDQNFGGLGLGLWISRQIVEGLGGRISFDSQEGRGTVFTVELPLKGGT